MYNFLLSTERQLQLMCTTPAPQPSVSENEQDGVQRDETLAEEMQALQQPQAQKQHNYGREGNMPGREFSELQQQPAQNEAMQDNAPLQQEFPYEPSSLVWRMADFGEEPHAMGYLALNDPEDTVFDGAFSDFQLAEDGNSFEDDGFVDEEDGQELTNQAMKRQELDRRERDLHFKELELKQQRTELQRNEKDLQAEKEDLERRKQQLLEQESEFKLRCQLFRPLPEEEELHRQKDDLKRREEELEKREQQFWMQEQRCQELEEQLCLQNEELQSVRDEVQQLASQCRGLEEENAQLMLQQGEGDVTVPDYWKVRDNIP